MKASLTLLLTAVTSVLVLPAGSVNLSDVPTWYPSPHLPAFPPADSLLRNSAITCVEAAIGATGCEPNDFKCICNSTLFITSVRSCIAKDCSAEDIETTMEMISGLCGSVGLPMSPALP
ncbi:hypothetical protein FN846DRAFT_895460 [Sphaerosporella brunnea]|uniref:CFEM domain-containing protein n=1 Tax=Sphaerosporella brunnea TaxID=1250544 RepID=A0A5J5EG06_9PEZI|nr:hypothetical protein FN846DRAFT_895460 [Sphaerosporella brunnea]